MGFFSRFFGGSNKNQPIEDIRLEPTTGIKYHPDLVADLKNDHQALFALYGSLVALSKEERFRELPKKLQEFKIALQSHILVENVQFYVYLQNKLKDDPMNLEFIKEVRKEMNHIARIVVNFTKKYERVGFSVTQKREFVKELETIGGVLTQRIKMEETKLYILYKP